MQGAGDSLVGRLFELHLMPLSLYERQGKGLQQEPYVPTVSSRDILEKRSTEELWQMIWQGAWPAVFDKSVKQREQFFEAFLMTFLERDIRLLGNIEKLSAFRKFMRALAIRTGQELRLNKLAELTGVTEVTVRRWLSVAEASGLIFLLEPFSKNRTKVLAKSPKVYMTDTGLAAYLCGIATAEALQTDSNADAFFETFVVTELLKSWRHNGREPRFFFYRDQKKQAEIDLLIENGGKYHPIEIKMTAHPSVDMVRHFAELKKLDVPTGTGALICMTPQQRFLSDDVVTHSLWQI